MTHLLWRSSSLLRCCNGAIGGRCTNLWTASIRKERLWQIQTRLRSGVHPQQAAEPDKTDSQATAYERLTKQLGPFSKTPLVGNIPATVLVISGPSGVGKDSVVRRVRQQRPDLHFVVTATTRPKRIREREGVDYHFVSKKTFEDWIRDDKLYEYATVYGEYKGVPKSSIDQPFAKGRDCVLRLDVQGAAHLRKVHTDCITIYISPYSEDEVVKRLIGRETETLTFRKDALRIRIQTMKEEIRRAAEFDYIVVNEEGKQDAAVSRILAILDAEKSRKAKICMDD